MKRAVLSSTLVLTGDVVADPDKSARIASPVAGRLEEVMLREGATVSKGQTLAVVRVPELGKVHAALAATIARAKAARADANRLKFLVEKALRPEQEYLEAKARAESLDADARGLSTQLSAMGAGAAIPASGASPFLLSLRAPFDAVVLSRTAVVGQPISTEEVLASLADLSEVWFLARLFEKDLDRVKAGAPVEVLMNAHPKEPFLGKVEAIGRQIDPIARTVTARIRLTNRSELLRIGLFGSARVGIAGDAAKGAVLVVPRSALTELSAKPVVFVRKGEDEFELREILLGEPGLGVVELVAGVHEGDEVVVDGVFNLKSALLKSTLVDDD